MNGPEVNEAVGFWLLSHWIWRTGIRRKVP
jgi:hypothetical protein